MPVVSPGTRPERPITSKAQDKLERSQFISRLRQALINPQAGNASGVVVGITGEWGSGKSSVLNLLAEDIKTHHDDALIVRFDPWLISGRDDLITAFITEVLRTIKGTPGAAEKLKGVTDSLTKYGEQLAPVASAWVPLLGHVLTAGRRIFEAAKKNSESLTALRSKLSKQLNSTTVPIIVLIDEVDRIEDAEIRAVAQLVRSIADFPGISYVLAYDAKRVVQALGAGAANSREREERGRLYLEKIVQLQIPLPVTFQEEVLRMIAAELEVIKADVGLPDSFLPIERYQELMNIVVRNLIVTPRDIARLIGAFHVIGGMLRGEVDSIDLLAYCVLVIKAPETVAFLKGHPEEFSDEILSEAGFLRRAAKNTTDDDRVKNIIPDNEYSDDIVRLVRFIFPHVKGVRGDDRPDALYKRRPLLATLRLGLLPGARTRAELEELVRGSAEAVKAAFQKAYHDGTFPELVDRIDDIYPFVSGVDHLVFWRGAAAFAAKPDCEWPSAYSAMHGAVRALSDVLQRAVKREPTLKAIAGSVFWKLRAMGELELTAHWIRTHIFAFGLFGAEKRHAREDETFLTESESDRAVREIAAQGKALHLAGKLIPCRWDLAPVYTMINTGDWDAHCRSLVDRDLEGKQAVDGLTLMLYGGGYTIEAATVDRICTLEKLLQRIQEREKDSDVHETVRIAFEKARRGGF